MTSASTYSNPVDAKRPSSTPNNLETNVPLQHEIQTLAERPFPDLNNGYYLHGTQPQQDANVWVITRQAALEQIRTHSISNLRTELGGCLLGRAYRTGKQLLVVVKAAIPAVSQDSGPVHFTFSADSWSQIHKDRAEQYADLDIVGWFHTHPALGVFYSGDDVVVHSAAFTLPWHVGLVVDPIRNEASFFGWEHGELVPFAGFYEKLDEQPEPVVKWRGVHTSVWSTSDYEPSAYEPTMTQPPTTAGFQRNSWFSPYLAVGVAAVSLLATFFFLIGWVVVLNQQVNQLETVVTTIADESLATTNAALCPDPNLRIIAPLTGANAFVGDTVTLLGTVQIPDATRYQLQTHLVGAEGWTTVDSRRWDTGLGTLGKWETKELLAGSYEVRLSAVDRNNIRLSSAPPCVINIELIP
ncbi:MAG: hypothetical protein DWQ04_18625 [Chloroflexi bacterium]|nr:MAG: hypothetical protein DWQ04_18625 [Chloroflexota bacterium]